MPRIKKSGQVEALERQRKELLNKLKEAKADARAAERERRMESARIAGTAFLDELDENPSGEAVQVLLALLGRRLTRSSDRARYGLADPSDSSSNSAAGHVKGEAQAAAD